MPSPRIRRLLPVAVAAAAALALTGCEPGALAPSASPGAGTDSPSATTEPSSSGPVETPEPTPAPTGSALPTTPPVAGEIACEDVLTAEQLYEFSPNFAPSSQQGSLPGAIGGVAEAGGTVCAFQHVTASDRLLVAVLQDAAGFSAPAFESAGGMGIATEPAGGSVIAVASEYFDGAPNAQPVLEDVAANLG
ncbi:hypothetical protein LG314_03555 [Agrococcus terreus]|uniref:hypothetical protein n=1 Tax=Agrococcus terreus TaxID=574649 RepID=UPI00384A8A3D